MNKTSRTRTLRLALLLAALANLVLAGCQSSAPPPTPISQRPAGQDISKEERVDKRGEVKY